MRFFYQFTRALVCMLALFSSTSAFGVQTLNGYRWRETGPVLNLNFKTAAGSAWLPFIEGAARQWGSGGFISGTVSTDTASTSCNAVWATIQICSGNYGATGWLGLTQIASGGGFTSDAVIRFNDYYFSQAKYDTSAWRELVSCHEIGHALGLNHADNSSGNKNLGTCLDVTQDPTGLLGLGPLADLQPGANDFALLRTIYGKTSNLYGSTSQVSVSDPFPAVLDVAEPGSVAALLVGISLLGIAGRRRAAR